MTEWKDDDEVTITYATLKQAMSASAETERRRIVFLLEEQMCKKCKSKPNEASHVDCAIVNECQRAIRGELK
jgi:hypothetical protein